MHQPARFAVGAFCLPLPWRRASAAKVETVKMLSRDFQGFENVLKRRYFETFRNVGHVLLRVVESLRTVRACWLLHPQEI